ncbi:MAG: AAA family ATPase [Pirellula sp.]
MNSDHSTPNPIKISLGGDLYETVKSVSDGSLESLGGYRLLDEIGRGGMGIVYRAEPVAGGACVALKTLQSMSPTSLTRLKAEFRALADLDHPNLIRLGELDATCKIPFFTMELVHGKPFDDYVGSGGDSLSALPEVCYNERRLRSALLQLSEGLVALHGAGLIHRDIKPSNVLVTSEGRVVLLDMGLVLETGASCSGNSQSEFAGTPYYMSPEQARGDSITPACDWYAVGVMLFEALTGIRAFTSKKINELLLEKSSRTGPNPIEVDRSVPEDLNELCAQLLQPLPSDRPSDQEILQRLQSQSASSNENSLWVGRDQELNALQCDWQDVRNGATRVVFISGESGIGKTSLVDHLVEHLRREENITVFRGRCYENESVAYRGFDSVIDSIASYLGRLPIDDLERVLPVNTDLLCQVFPVLEEVAKRSRMKTRSPSRMGDPREQKQKGINALRELISRLAQFSSVLIFIDDLHQGDEETAAIFRALLPSDDAPNILFLATYRREASDSKCLQLVRQCILPPNERSQLAEQREISIDRLSRDETIKLSKSLLQTFGVLDEDSATRVADEANGDPLFVRMLAEHLVSERSTEKTPRRETTSWTLASVIEKRIESLEPNERMALELLAAAGRPLEEEVLEATIDPEKKSVGLVRSLRVKRLIRRLSDLRSIESFHDKIREAVSRKLSARNLSIHCLKLARQMDLPTGKRNVEFLADLYRRGGEPIRAGDCYEAAAVNAQATFAFARATEYYQYALELLPPNVDRERSLRIGLAEVLANQSRSPESAKQYLAAAELAPANESMVLRQRAALRYLTSGHVDEGIAALRSVLEYYRLPWPTKRWNTLFGLVGRLGYLRVRGLRCKNQQTDKPTVDRSEDEKIEACWTAAAGFSLVDPLRGCFYIAETLIRSLRSASKATLPRDLGAYIGQVAIGGSKSRRATRQVLLANRALKMNRTEPYYRASLFMSRGIAALLRGQWSAARGNCDKAITYLEDERCHGATWEMATSRTFALWALQYQGNLIELRRRQPDLLRSSLESDDLFATLNFSTQVMAHLELSQNRSDETHRKLDEDCTRLSTHGFYIQHHNYILARTYAYLYENKASEAMNTIDGQWNKYRSAMLSQVQQVRIDHRQVLIRALIANAAANQDRKGMIAKAHREVSLLRRERAPWADALAMVFEASITNIQGQPAQASEKLRLGANMLHRVNMHLFANAALHHLHQRGKEENESKNWWDQQQVLEPDRMASMLLPGF